MRATAKVILWIAACFAMLAALAVALVGIVVLAADTDWGRRVIESATDRLSGNRIVIAGLSGRIPDDVRLAHLELRDGEGPWLRADDVALQWSPSRLLHKEVSVALVRAARIELLRRPPTADRGGQTGELPRIDVDRLEVDRLDIAAPIAGATASVAVRGDAHVRAADDAQAHLSVTRIDAPGSYELTARIDAAALNAELVADEPEHGLLSGLASLPDLGAVSARVSIEGPRSAEATRFTLAAGPLRAEGHGLVDLVDRTLALDVTANAPAMAPRADLSWKSASLQAHIDGPFTAPDATGQLQIDELAAGGGTVRSVRAGLSGNRGAVSLRATLERLRLPGPRPAVLESSPIDVRADARLDDPARPVTFAVSHPLLSLEGSARTAGGIECTATLKAVSIAPLAAIAGVDLKGPAAIDARIARRGDATDVRLEGTVGVTEGPAPLPALIGPAAKIELAATVRGDEIAVTQATVTGRTLRASAQGTARRDDLDFDWKMALSDLAVVTSAASGRAEAQGILRGRRDSLDVSAEANGDVATHGFASGPIAATVRLNGVPSAPAGKIDAHGMLDGSPVQLAVTLDTRDGVVRGTIQRADWKSAHAEGQIALRAQDRLPQGRIELHVADLDNLRPWIGEPVQGTLAASATFAATAGRVDSAIDLDVRNAGMSGARVERLHVAGTVSDVTARRTVDFVATAQGIASHGATGSARLQATGPADALQLALSSELHDATVGDVPLSAKATLDATARRIAIAAFQARYKGEPVQLLAPVRISFGDGVAVDRLRLGMQQAVLEVAGRLSPTLDATASLRNVTPALAKSFDADVQADGTLTMDARLTGTLAMPRGSVKVAASGLHMRTGSARSLPPLGVTASADLQGESAQVDAKLSAGSQVHLDAAGRVPLSADGNLDVHARGTVDAAVVNPVLEVNGRRVKGKLVVDAGLAGTLAAPRVEGTLRVTEGELQDYALGVQLTKIDALFEANGDSVRISSLTAHAGAGTISASGTVGVLAPGRPVDVKVVARNAKPFATDLLTADLDADLTLRGEARTRVNAAGSILVHRAEIKIPKALPPTVAVLDVRRIGEKAPPPRAPGLVVGLDLKVDAPRAVFVRGRGLDAETGGELQITGTTAAPQIAGGFTLRRGSFDLGGASLNFTSGKVSFTGTGLSQKIDPTLDFVAESTYNSITARLAVTGYADAPRIALTSTPELPQDEILARLLFGVSTKELSPLQLAQIAAAVATISGVGGDNPLAAVQKSLGLDRLSAGSTSTGGTTIEAGRYVMEGVYIGAKQSTRGGTQAQVQVDLTKNLKLQATLGTGGTVPVQGTTPENDPGSSIGLSYQFEY